MKMKKSVKSLLMLALAYILTPFVSAQLFGGNSGYFFETGMNQVIESVKGFAGPLFEVLIGVGQYDQYFFARILLLILVFVIAWVVLQRVSLFGNRRGIIFIISAIVAILGARYIGELEIINTLLLPYGALTIALSTILPFFIFFYFLHVAIGSGAGRRAAAVFFAIIFIGLWLTRRDTIPEFAWIYNLAMVGTILAIIFDARVHEWFGLAETRAADVARLDGDIARVEEELNRYGAIQNPSTSVRSHLQRLEARRQELSRRRARL